jgi:EAL domain-containing protein (putative c-di-GMP-specific phosphodiesterase class I)
MRLINKNARTWARTYMPCSDLRFLVVEDHPFQRTVLVRLLQTMGAGDVQIAADGEAALEVLRDAERPVDIVITDLSMPGMDGMEFVRHLSELGSAASLIIASALDQSLLAIVGAMARGYQVRILGMIGKPATAAKLTPLIELHRSAAVASLPPAAAFPLDVIATSWSSHDFDPWFAPEIELADGALSSLLAVPHWHHPDRGELGPESFMPSIEARGLGREFAWMMLREAAQRCADWRARVEAGVTVPLLFDHFDDPTLAHRIIDATTQANLQARDAVLVVPAAGLQAQEARVLENLARLRMEGFGLALAVAADEPLAIDAVTLGAFTHLRIPAALAGTERFAAALQLGREAGLRTTVEGVARSSEWQALPGTGCAAVQGPLIAPALHPEHIGGWIRRRLRAANGSQAA